MADGLILLGFVALLLALVWMRVRRRAGMRTGGSVLAAAVAFFAIAILILWATSRH